MRMRKQKPVDTHTAASNEGALIWSYEDGRLNQTVNGAKHALSAMDTLALVNLLYSNYREIVAYARKEQRKQEGEADRRRHPRIIDLLCENDIMGVDTR